MIFQHTWIKVTGNLPGESTPMDLAELAKRNPEATLICGHTGGDWELGIRAVRPYANISVDLAGGDPVAGITEMAVRELGAERVIYGSDAGGRSFASQLAKVQGADIPEQAKRSILAGNLKPLETHPRRKGGAFVTGRLIDVNVNLSRWPTRRMPARRDGQAGRQAPRERRRGGLGRQFRRASSQGRAAVNARLARECREPQAVRLIPFGSINPLLPDWEEDLRRCVLEHRMPGIRLHPNYHGYTLDHPAFARLLKPRHGPHALVVCLSLIMEDERMMHPRFRVPPWTRRPSRIL